MTNERNEAVQAVLDRVTSYQDGATDGTVDKELREALGEAGIDLTEDQVGSLLDAVEKADGPVSADDVLG